jgi:BlaR1 peptidase M56
METLFVYLLKSSGLIAVFYLAYHFLVRKETFFNSNRWFLITGLFTSLLLPLFTINKIVYVEGPKIAMRDLVAYTNTTNTIQEIPATATFDWMQFIWVSYIIIACLLIINVAGNLFSLYRMLFQQQVIKKESFKLVNLNKNIAPFSFFNYIVYNSELYTEEELQSILLHEKIHSQEKHSFDVMIAKMFCIVFWFNPFVWLYKKAITQNLEYIADQKAIQQLDDKKSYQRALLKVVSNQNCLSITNNFYQSLIKKRIVMLNKNQSHKRNSWKYTLVIPALIAFVFLFQINTIAQEKNVTIITQSTENRSGGDVTFDSKETDESLKSLKNIFKSENIVTDITKIKRNTAGEITGVQIKMSSEDGRKKELKINQSNPIDKIYLYTNKLENGIYDFGVKHVTTEELNVVRNKSNPKKCVFISQNGEDSYSFNTNDSISEIKELNFSFTSPESAELIAFAEMPEVPEKITWNNQETHVIIKKEGKEPLVLINGKVVEGDESILSKKELEEIRGSIITSENGDENTQIIINGKDISKIRSKALSKARVQIKSIKPQLKNFAWSTNTIEQSKPEMEKAKAEMIQAKEEMLKAKAEMQAAKEELEKAKAELKKNVK